MHLVHSVDEALFTFGSIDVYDLGIVTDISDRKFGIACPLGGEAAFQYVKRSLSWPWKVRWMPPSPMR